MVQEAVDDYSSDTEERKIEWNIHPLSAVEADRALLRLVFVNLISNAVKFTAGRNPPKIEIGCTEVLQLWRGDLIGWTNAPRPLSRRFVQMAPI
jgi:signal transduction histidine kinase